MILKNIPELSERLKYIRKMKSLSQVELADICGATQQAIQQAEMGKAKNPRYLHKLALTLNVPYEWLTMNIQPAKRHQEQDSSGFNEKESEVLSTFFSMPKKDQSLLLELMKTRHKRGK